MTRLAGSKVIHFPTQTFIFYPFDQQVDATISTGGAAEATGLAVLLGAGWFSAVALGARLVTRQGKWLWIKILLGGNEMSR